MKFCFINKKSRYKKEMSNLRVCSGCGTHHFDLLECEKCKCTYYCSPECQDEALVTHASACKRLAQENFTREIRLKHLQKWDVSPIHKIPLDWGVYTTIVHYWAFPDVASSTLLDFVSRICEDVDGFFLMDAWPQLQSQKSLMSAVKNGVSVASYYKNIPQNLLDKMKTMFAAGFPDLVILSALALTLRETKNKFKVKAVVDLCHKVRKTCYILTNGIVLPMHTTRKFENFFSLSKWETESKSIAKITSLEFAPQQLIVRTTLHTITVSTTCGNLYVQTNKKTCLSCNPDTVRDYRIVTLDILAPNKLDVFERTRMSLPLKTCTHHNLEPFTLYPDQPRALAFARIGTLEADIDCILVYNVNEIVEDRDVFEIQSLLLRKKDGDATSITCNLK